MIKFLAALIIISGFWCIGQSKNARMGQRLSFLRRIVDGLRLAESEIRGLCAPLPVAFEKAATVCPLFGEAARLSADTDAGDAFLRALEPVLPEKEEKEILQSFAGGLHAEEQEGQLANIAHCLHRLTALCDRLETETGRLGRLYSGSGVLTGILVVILLL